MQTLKRFVARGGGVRLALHERTRDRLVEMAVEEWPTGCPPDRIEEVLAAKMRIRVRQEYGSIVAMILVGVMINIIVKLVTEWWFSAMSHRVLMEGWHKNALEAARVQAEEKAR